MLKDIEYPGSQQPDQLWDWIENNSGLNSSEYEWMELKRAELKLAGIKYTDGAYIAINFKPYIRNLVDSIFVHN